MRVILITVFTIIVTTSFCKLETEDKNQKPQKVNKFAFCLKKEQALEKISEEEIKNFTISYIVNAEEVDYNLAVGHMQGYPSEETLKKDQDLHLNYFAKGINIIPYPIYPVSESYQVSEIKPNGENRFKVVVKILQIGNYGSSPPSYFDFKKPEEMLVTHEVCMTDKGWRLTSFSNEIYSKRLTLIKLKYGIKYDKEAVCKEWYGKLSKKWNMK